MMIDLCGGARFCLASNENISEWLVEGILKTVSGCPIGITTGSTVKAVSVYPLYTIRIQPRPSAVVMDPRALNKRLVIHKQHGPEQQ